MRNLKVFAWCALFPGATMLSFVGCDSSGEGQNTLGSGGAGGQSSAGGETWSSKSESSCYSSNTHRVLVKGNIFIQPAAAANNLAIAKEVTTKAADDGTIAFDKVIFDASLNMSIVDTSRWYVYSSRGHRWTF